MESTLSFYTTVKAGLDQVEGLLRRVPEDSDPLIRPILSHILGVSGKRIRPAVTLLASRLDEGSDQSAILMASGVELLHIATLIHDDMVDNASIRRGQATIGTVWDPHTAVLIGDYIFATSATFVCDTMSIRVVRRFSETIMELSSGELMERFSTFNWRQSRKEYEDRIYNKTACLFSTAAETGAVLGGASESVVGTLKSYGRNLGMAFQIIDDILDYEATTSEVGKPVGNDLAHGILTLPALLFIERYPENNPVIKLFQKKDPIENQKRALEMIHSSSIIAESYSIAAEFSQTAIEDLEGLPNSSYKRALVELANYGMERHR